MRTLWLTLFAVIMASGAHANPRVCDLQTPDLTLPLKSTNGNPAVLTSTRYGTDMSRVSRYILSYADGSSNMLEQYGCGGTNLRLTLMSLQQMPSLLELNRMGGILKATPFWRNYFGELDASRLLQNELGTEDFQSRIAKSAQFFYNADERIASPSVKNTAIIGFMQGNAGTQFRTMLTLTLGVGGQ